MRERNRRGPVQRLRALLDTDQRQIDEADDEARSRLARGVEPIASVTDRERAHLFGTVLSMTYPPAPGPQILVARLYDGTASIELRWPGRSGIPGLHVGAHIEAEGTVSKQGDAAVIINPLYRVIAMEA